MGRQRGRWGRSRSGGGRRSGSPASGAGCGGGSATSRHLERERGGGRGVAALSDGEPHTSPFCHPPPRGGGGGRVTDLKRKYPKRDTPEFSLKATSGGRYQRWREELGQRGPDEQMRGIPINRRRRPTFPNRPASSLTSNLTSRIGTTTGIGGEATSDGREGPPRNVRLRPGRFAYHNRVHLTGASPFDALVSRSLREPFVAMNERSLQWIKKRTAPEICPPLK